MDTDPLDIDSEILSGLRHAIDDPERFLDACTEFTARSYDRVKKWFDREFHFLRADEREDAMHDFFLTLSKRLMTEYVQARIRQFREDREQGRVRFRRYLKVTAVNAARDFARHERRREGAQVRTDFLQQLEARAEKLMGEVLAEDTELMLSDIKSIARVTDREWQAFLATIDFSNAEREETSRQATYAAASRVRKKLELARPIVLRKYGELGDLLLAEHLSVGNLELTTR
ncbi:hypothetical protein [Rubinisphaera margarita]|uniref:hypothetical protein n=1 Tax=Rubinisphaera margarita TaxID=2909586 RepID=UPI001EE86D71|nr:hypothetical protein [Rubinisphaera margarita]MCG6158221.1 hypothetical protein [Rubinisphaera margarita]